MNCTDARNLVHAYLDGELDLMRQMEIDDHLRQCQACPPIYDSQRALQSALKEDGLYFTAPPRLQRQVRASIRAAAAPARWRSWGLSAQSIGVATAAAIIILAVAMGPMLSRRSHGDQIAQEVVSAHIRSLMVNHLTDVPSSDQHTVKPWFAGKLDFSPAVIDLQADGFSLVGGRLDYVENRPVAALAYRRGAHVINLFVWPSASSGDTSETLDTRQGYNVVSWTSDHANSWAVSDLNPTELRQFAQLVRDRMAGR